MTEERRKKLKKISSLVIPLMFYVLFAIFIAIYIQSLDFSTLKDINVAWEYVLVASIFGLAFRYWGVYIWIVLLRSLGAKDLGSKAKLAYVYAKSWLGRYIPSPAAWMMGKVYFASKHGISKNKLAVSSLLEGALQVLVVMTVSFVMLIFDRRLDVIQPKFKLLMFGIICVGIIMMTPKLFNFSISLAYKLLKKKELDVEHLASRETIVKGASLYTIGAIISGLSLFFIAKGVYPSLGYGNVVFVMGVGNLAGAASMLAVFAPSGLGVREGIQLVLLSLIMPKEFALVITVVTRVWGIAMDFIFFGLAKLIASRKKQTASSDE